MKTLGNRNLFWKPYKNPVEIKEWENFCIGYSAKTRRIRVMHNGNIEVEHIRPLEVSALQDFIPSIWFGPTIDENVCM